MESHIELTRPVCRLSNLCNARMRVPAQDIPTLISETLGNSVGCADQGHLNEHKLSPYNLSAVFVTHYSPVPKSVPNPRD